MRSIMSTAAFEGNKIAVLRKPAFMIGDAAPGSDQQLLTEEDQWIFKLGEDNYYLPSSKHHFPLSFFKTVTMERKMAWHVTRSIDSVHVGILSSQGYNRSGPLDR